MVSAVVAVSLLACSDDEEHASRGASLYVEHCASCHGSALEGQADWRLELPGGGFPAPPHDSSGHTWRHGDDYLFDVTKQGGAALAPEGFQSRMPAFGDVLDDADIRLILAYIKSRWPEEQLRYQERVNERSDRRR